MIETITNIDFSILDFIQQYMKFPFMDSVSGAVNILMLYGFAVWGVMAVVLLFFRKTRSAGIMMIVSMLLVYTITQLGIKNIVQRPRPFVVRPLSEGLPDHAHATGYSFPSGHSAISFTCATILFMRNKKVNWLFFIFAGLVGFTRMYMYVHYPSDVLCGAFFGVVIALMVYFIFKNSGLIEKIDGTAHNKRKVKKGKLHGRTKNR